MIKMRSLLLGITAIFTVVPSLSAAPVLRPNDLVAICGDSITEQKLYSLFIEQYLLLCQPNKNLMAMQFGWGGERASGFAARVQNDVLTFKPTVVTLCYGMNDGNYAPVTPSTVANYRKFITEAVQKLKEAGVRIIVIGSPGVVDPAGFRQPNVDAVTYNQTLAALRDAAKEIAISEDVLFSDLHAVMMDAMKSAKATLGNSYRIAADGFHPSPNGHLAMAYAFLKALGVDGDIGTFTVDYAAQTASATDGHQILGYANGEISVESNRYPFCFTGKSDGNGTLAMSKFLPFNQDLNRYMLVVRNAPSQLRITWGSESKVFTAEQLHTGINLAAEFPENPFKSPFTAAGNVMLEQQNLETKNIKGLLNNLPKWRSDLPEGASHYNALQVIITRMSEEARAASRATSVPVKHSLKIEPLSLRFERVGFHQISSKV